MRQMKPMQGVTLRAGRLLLVLAVAVCASAGTMFAVAFGAGSSGAQHFAIFTGRASVAGSGTAAVGGIAPPAGARLAVVAGSNSVFAWQPSNAEICVVDLEAAGIGGVACDRTPQAEAHGVVLALRPGATALAGGATLTTAVLVPDGVSTVTFVDRSGSIRTSAIENNVAVLADAQLASVRYSIPAGGEFVQPIPTSPAPASAAPTPGSE